MGLLYLYLCFTRLLQVFSRTIVKGATITYLTQPRSGNQRAVPQRPLYILVAFWLCACDGSLLPYVGNVRDLACLLDGRVWRGGGGSVWLIKAVLKDS